MHADTSQNRADGFIAERPRLVRLAGRILGDEVEAEDIVQGVWLRLDDSDAAIDNLPAWLTTVTVRMCLDRLRRRVPAPVEDLTPMDTAPDPADDFALADTVGVALQVVLDRLSPNERVAFVMHDTFGFEFPTIATLLEVSPAAARQLASRARVKVRQPAAEHRRTDWRVVDAFLAAARTADFTGLLGLLAPDVVVRADDFAIVAGTPERIDGRDAVAGFFNGAAAAAMPVFVDDRPGAAWFNRGEARVVFDFTIEDGVVREITFRADPDVLAAVIRRDDDQPRS